MWSYMTSKAEIFGIRILCTYGLFLRPINLLCLDYKRIKKSTRKIKKIKM